HYYCDKIIGTSLLGTIPYGMLRLILGRHTAERFPELARYITRTFSVSVCGAVAVVVLYDILLLFSATLLTAVVLSLLFAFGTMFFPYNTVFYSYAPAVLCVLLAFRKILRCNRANAHPGDYLVIGLLLGGALLFEYTFGIVVVALLILLVAKQRTRLSHFAICGTGVVLALLPFLIYTIAIFGTITIPYKYEVSPIFREGMTKGIMGITTPRLTVLYYITIHPYRGIFFLSPFLIFAFAGVVLWLKKKQFLAETLVSLGIILGYLLFNSSYYMWWGGWAVAPRHLLPMIPFMILLLIPVVQNKNLTKENSTLNSRKDTKKQNRRNQKDSKSLSWLGLCNLAKEKCMLCSFLSNGDFYKTLIRYLIYLTGVVSIFFHFVIASIDPQAPQGYHTIYLLYPRISYNFKSPLLYHQLPAFLDGKLDPNLGTLLGIPALLSLTPLLIFTIIILILIALRIKSLLPHT
ncbi:glycosyltransferase family 39 protein, partial [Candidatus Sumerlaeota bacterium]|nr:glycosyltransferase family 39 protein [Candidatus Sumerlaeota bacterium]